MFNISVNFLFFSMANLVKCTNFAIDVGFFFIIALRKVGNHIRIYMQARHVRLQEIMQQEIKNVLRIMQKYKL